MVLKRVPPDWETLLPTGSLSASAVDLYLICPRAYYYRYIEKLPDMAVPVSIIEGKAIHHVMEENQREKVNSGEDMEKENLVTLWHDTFSDTSKVVTDWDEEKPDDVHVRGETQVMNFRSYYAKKFKALSEDCIERKSEGKVDGVPTVAYLDLISQTEEDERKKIVDWKVVKRAKSQLDVEDGIQMGIYSILEGIRDVEFVCFVKTKEPSIKRISGVRTEKSLEKVGRVISSVAETVRKGNFPFCDPCSWKCSSKFCGFWWKCPQGAGGKG